MTRTQPEGEAEATGFDGGFGQSFSDSSLDHIPEGTIPMGLKEGEYAIIHKRPSWYAHISELIYMGLGIGIITTLFLWVNTSIISFGFEDSFGSLVSMTQDGIRSIGAQFGLLAPDAPISIPLWLWVIALLIPVLPFLKSWLLARYTHYVVTNQRVAIITNFIWTVNNDVELDQVNNMTTVSGPIATALGIGSVWFKPANSDNVAFRMIEDYDAVKTKVLELQDIREQQMG